MSKFIVSFMTELTEIWESGDQGYIPHKWTNLP